MQDLSGGLALGDHHTVLVTPAEVGVLGGSQLGEFPLGVGQAVAEVAKGLSVLVDGLLSGLPGGLGAGPRRLIPPVGRRPESYLLLRLVAQQLGPA